ncbi:MAG: type IV-A pilus assembly ATPase PilB [Legionella sp.]|nr:MAG: type IV-A pilus assembly ATPase PilB [Legionella sp.]
MDDKLAATALLLVQKKVITQDAAWHYQRAAHTHSCRFLPYLVLHAQVCPKSIAQMLADHFRLPFIDLSALDSSLLPKQFLTPELLRHHHALPIKCDAEQLYVAIDDPNQHATLKEIQFLTGHPIIPMIAETTRLALMIDEVLRDTDHQGLTHYLHGQSIDSPSPESLSHHLLPLQDETPIVAFVQRILHQAIARGATDLHFEPYADRYRIRYRQDGTLYELATPPQVVSSRIAARLKIMGDLDISERRLPQDGRFSIAYTLTQTIDCRISTCPTITGEKISIRFLNAGWLQLDMAQLGLSDRDKHCFLEALYQSQGLILVTGPTGSGKTVTLYTALKHLNTGNKNISSAEDPVEIKQSGINQVQINPKIGLTFATVLRSFLRQDPDVIMLGEIRDYETADIALKAAHTGHLVLSTLHTNSCAQTLIRLKQLNMSPFILASSLTLIVAQRLIKLLCPYCKILDTTMPTQVYLPQGCHRCHKGYQGRKAIFEVMPMSQPLQTLMLSSKATADSIKHQAQAEGMLTLRQAGLMQVYQGLTSVEEINQIR